MSVQALDTPLEKTNYETISEEIKDLVERVIRPNADQIDREGIFPRENLNVLIREGWGNILVPQKYNGRGADHTAHAIVVEEIAKACASTALIFSMHVLAIQNIVEFGTEDQIERWVKPIEKALLGTYSSSERGSGGHFWYNLSQVTRDGNDYIYDAEKSFTTSAGHADFYLTQMRSPDAKDAKEICLLIIDSKLPGIETSRWNTLGVRGNHSYTIHFNNVRIPRDELVGEEGKALPIVDQTEAIYLLGLGSTWTGVARHAYELAANHLIKATHNHRGHNLANYQILRHKLVETKLLLKSLKPWRLQLTEQLNAFKKRNESPEELTLELMEYKVHASEVAHQAASMAMDVSGGYGYVEGEIERVFRDSRAGIAMGPSNNLARDLISKAELGLPLELWEKDGD
ncbi:acyl-CoA dehydrogenase [Bacillus freudenreichii]|nr:acyl-CoA dehydrogenase [Bacillus freudenreichii]